jgi:hypothetical protein
MIKRESGIAKGIKKKMVDEGEITENDLIIVPGVGKRLKPGLIPRDKVRTDHEVEMARSDLIQCVKNSKTVFSLIKDLSEDDGLEGWVQEKITKAEDYLNTVREYLEGKLATTEATSAGVRMQRALQREKEKRERSERYAQERYPIGTKPTPINEPQKDVKENEDPHDWMAQMKAMAHELAPQDKFRQAHQERMAQEKADLQARIAQDRENLPELEAEYRDMLARYKQLGGSNYQYADREQNLSREEREARDMEYSIRSLGQRIRAAQKLDEVAPPGAKAERMVKHIKKSYSKDGKLTPKEKSIAYATAWKAHNKGSVEEAANIAQQRAIAVNMKKQGKKPKNEDVSEEKQRLDPSCWTGYKKQGTKMKGGVRVNNCVPKESVAEDTDGQLPQDTLDLIDEYIAKVEPGADRNQMIRDVNRGVIHTSELEYALQDDSQGVAEGAPIIVMPSHKRLEKKDKPSLSRGMDPAKAQGIADAQAGKPYNNPYPFKPELGAPGNHEHNLYRASYDAAKKGVAEESKGLWANIHAKRERIKHGSGEHMRKPGSKGAPTADALRKSAK